MAREMGGLFLPVAARGNNLFQIRWGGFILIGALSSEGNQFNFSACAVSGYQMKQRNVGGLFSSGVLKVFR